MVRPSAPIRRNIALTQRLKRPAHPIAVCTPGAKLPVIMSSPAFQGRAHVDLKRPSLVVLPVEKSVALDDTLYIDHSVLAGVSVREAFAYLFTIVDESDDPGADSAQVWRQAQRDLRGTAVGANG